MTKRTTAQTLAALNAKLDKIFHQLARNTEAQAKLVDERYKLKTAYDAIENEIVDIEEAMVEKAMAVRQKLVKKVSTEPANQTYTEYVLRYRGREVKVKAKFDRNGNFDAWVAKENGKVIDKFDLLNDVAEKLALGEI